MLFVVVCYGCQQPQFLRAVISPCRYNGDQVCLPCFIMCTVNARTQRYGKIGSRVRSPTPWAHFKSYIHSCIGRFSFVVTRTPTLFPRQRMVMFRRRSISIGILDPSADSTSHVRSIATTAPIFRYQDLPSAYCHSSPHGSISRRASSVITSPDFRMEVMEARDEGTCRSDPDSLHLLILTGHELTFRIPLRQI